MILEYKRRLNLWPHRCSETNELIWPLQIAYCGIEFQVGHLIVQWYSKKGHMLRILKGETK